MSKPRKTELKLRQRRKKKLAHLRKKYAHAKTQTSKDSLLEKAILVSPGTARDTLYKTLNK